MRFGLFTYGGGWSIVAQMDQLYVQKKKIITSEELLDLVSVAKSVPGTMIANVAMLFGYRAAGLAGGSADAAAVLRGAVQLLQLNISQEELLALGLSLGADIPFCLSGGLALVEGIGEELMPLEPARRLLVIANPGCQQPTKAVFAACGPAVAAAKDEGREEALALATALGSASAAEVSALCRNDMLAAAMSLSPQIEQLMADFTALGLMPQLSGSGATVFAVCDDESAAAQAVAVLKAKWPFAVACHTVM